MSAAPGSAIPSQKLISEIKILELLVERILLSVGSVMWCVPPSEIRTARRGGRQPPMEKEANSKGDDNL